MNKTVFLAVFSIFILFIGISSSTFAQASNIGSSGGDLVVSNIGSSGQDGVDTKTVPAWIKTSMQFWVEGQTSDTEFLNAVEFLAKEEIIRVDGGDVRKDITINVAGKNSTTGSWDTEILSMDAAARSDSFFDIFYESYSADSFFDIFTDLQHSSDSFFDVFFDVDTPRTNECLRGQEMVFDKRTSSWQCGSANTVDSFFDVFFDVTTDTAQNSKDIDELERKILVLEKKIEDLENKNTSTRPAT